MMNINIKNMASLLVLVCFYLSARSQEVVEFKIPNSNKIVIELQFRNGSVCDPAGKEGLTMLAVNTVMAGGTKDLTSKQINDMLYPMAINYYATVDKEVSVFTFEMPVDFFAKFFPVMKEMVINPRFDEIDFNRVKSNQQNYVDQVIRSSSDEEYGKKLLENFIFRGTNYQNLNQGTSAGVKGITLEDAKKHYSTFFTTKNLSIGIAGNYTPEILGMVKSEMNKLPQTIPAIPIPAKAKQSNGITVEITSKENALGSAISMGFPLAINRTSDDFAALMIANSWLGEHRKSYSRLYQKIREQRSMNYGDYSYIEWYDNGGQNMLPVTGYPRSSNYFSIWIRPVQTAKGLKGQYPELSDIKTGHAHFAIRMAVREMENMITNGMTKEDVELTKTFLLSYIKLYAQTPAKQLGYLMDSRFYGRKDYLREMDQLLKNCTVEQVNAAMKKYWQTQNLYISIVTDASEVDELSKSLKENTPSPMSYSNSLKVGMSKNILDEDELVSTYKLNVTKVDIIKSADTFK